jgi:hypothetical protein
METLKGFCPNCNKVVEFQRRPPGTGSEIDPNKPLNENEKQILNVLIALGNRGTVRQIAAYLFANRVPRNGPAWSTHYCQRDISYHVGRGLVSMEREGKSFVYSLNHERLLEVYQR